MSKVKTTIYLVLLLALVNIATSIQLRAQTTTTTKPKVDSYTRINRITSSGQNDCTQACQKDGDAYVRFETEQWKPKTWLCGCQALPKPQVDLYVELIKQNENSGEAQCIEGCKNYSLVFSTIEKRNPNPKTYLCGCKRKPKN